MSSSSPCISCGPLPSCPGQCQTGQICQLVSGSCSQCPFIQCSGSPTSSKSSGISKGALAGAVIGVLLFLAIVIALVWFFQRRSKLRRAQQARALEPKPEVPAPAATVLSRPDPLEKPSTPTHSHVRVFSTQSDTTINLDPSERSQGYPEPSLGRSGVESPTANPFADQSSLRSASDQSHPNLIPIAMLPYGSVQSSAVPGSEVRRSRDVTSPAPSRPLRSPDLNLRLDPSGRPSAYDLTHVNVSDDSVLNIRNPAASSVRSDVSGMSAGSRASYLTTGTYATDLFTESPTIVTRQQGKIVGLSKAQVVEVPASFSSGGSPLASSHLTPTASRLSRMTTSRSIRSPLAQSSFTPTDIIEMDEPAETSPFADNHARQQSPILHRQINNQDDRSVRTNGTFGSQQWIGDDAGSVASGVEASITSAKRVIVGANGRVVSASSTGALSATSNGPVRYSFTSEASSRADSILEAFPFVPPSPISQQSFRSVSRSPVPPSPITAEPPSTVNTEGGQQDRRMLGISTFSQASSGLEAFPFQLQLDSAADVQSRPPGSFLPGAAAARASLDTLALSRDLTAFPLPYDDESEHSSPAANSKFAAPSRKSSTTQARH